MTVNNILKKIKEMKINGLLAENLDMIIADISNIHDSTLLSTLGSHLKTMRPKDWNTTLANKVDSVKVAVLSNFTANELENLLPPLFLLDHICPDINVADFDQYCYEMLDEKSSLYQFNPDITLLLLDEHCIFNILDIPWRLDDLKNALDSFTKTMDKLIDVFCRSCKGILVTNTIQLSNQSYNHILGYKPKAKLSQMWNAMNAKLLQNSIDNNQVICLDTQIISQKNGLLNNYDTRLFYYAKMHMSVGLLEAFAQELRAICRSIRGKVKKCLVLDLDETLWGGIIGEQGVSHIELGSSPEGEAYVDFQKYLKQLASQGILLAINSKNDEENVEEVFIEHTDMQLKKDDFLVRCINWNPKHENIKYIAESLNIGVDSLVFVDDSPYECNIVKENCPEVGVVHVEEPPFQSIAALMDKAYFNSIEVTEADIVRTKSYASDIKRRDFLKAHDSINDYLNDLNVQVELFSFNEFSLPRLAQLNQRTNQFNMTTKRYTEKELETLAQRKNVLVLGIKSSDRFGENGIVGCIILESTDSDKSIRQLCIRNFILSCRVFSRRIEIIALNRIIKFAQNLGVSEIIGEYIRSNKNTKIEKFYQQNKFDFLKQQGDVNIYRYKIANTVNNRVSSSLRTCWNKHNLTPVSS